MGGKLLCGLIISLCLFSALEARADCSVTSHCGFSIETDSKPVTPGCKALEVIVHNDTNFEFDVDKTYSPSTTLGDISVFKSVKPGESKTFIVQGVYVDSSNQDDVDTSVRYIAKYKNPATGVYDKNPGTQFVINLKKTSCNSSSPVIHMTDYRCYYDCRVCDPPFFTSCHWSGCTIGSVGYSNGRYCDVTCTGQTPDAVCKSYYSSYESLSCNKASSTLLTSMSSGSSISPTPGIYTIGAGNLDANNYGRAEDPSIKYTTSSYFICDKSSECSNSSDNDDGCAKGGTSDHNKTAKLEFYIKPSPIEKLTVHFLSSSVSAQTNVSHAILQSLYNNLNPEYLAQLGTYWLLTPVQINADKKSITFSMLCNDASCKQAS